MARYCRMAEKFLPNMPKSLLNQSLKNTGLFKTVFFNLTLIDLKIIVFLHWILNNYNVILRLAKSPLGYGRFITLHWQAFGQ